MMTEPEPLTELEQDTRISVDTRFGAFEADLRDMVTFPDGMPGFEACRRFVVLSSIEMAPIQCLHAVDGPPASFLAIDPRLVLPSYRSVLSQADRLRLGVTDEGPLLWLALVTVADDNSAVVNLRAPIVINPTRMTGFQVMPHNSLYPLRYPLADDAAGGHRDSGPEDQEHRG